MTRALYVVLRYHTKYGSTQSDWETWPVETLYSGYDRFEAARVYHGSHASDRFRHHQECQKTVRKVKRISDGLLCPCPPEGLTITPCQVSRLAALARAGSSPEDVLGLESALACLGHPSPQQAAGEISGKQNRKEFNRARHALLAWVFQQLGLHTGSALSGKEVPHA